MPHETTKCPSCDGARTFPGFVDGPSGGRFDAALPCGLCHGSGVVPLHVVHWLSVGRAHRERRVENDEGLRECARRIGISAVELSAMENGRADPARLEVNNG